MQGITLNNIDCRHNDCFVLSGIVSKQASDVWDKLSYACICVSKLMGMLSVLRVDVNTSSKAGIMKLTKSCSHAFPKILLTSGD